MRTVYKPPHIKQIEAVFFEGMVVESLYSLEKYSRITKGNKYRVNDVVCLPPEGLVEDIFFVIKDDNENNASISYKFFTRPIS